MSNNPPKILLVEEDALLAEVTAFRLELLGYEVTCVDSGNAALDHVLEQPPEAMILDLALPDMPGLEVINQLKNDNRTNAVPVLAFSTDADLEAVQRAFAAGVQDYLVTPYDPIVLQSKLEKLLQTASV